MIVKRFEAYKLARELRRSGEWYSFRRYTTNEFGEVEDFDDSSKLGCIRGIYHEQNSNIQINTGDTTQVRTKKIPMILCLWDELLESFCDQQSNLDLMPGDFTMINGKVYRVTGIVNVQEWNIVADISLEVVDNAS